MKSSLVFKAHRLVVSLNSRPRVIKKKKEARYRPAATFEVALRSTDKRRRDMERGEERTRGGGEGHGVGEGKKLGEGVGGGGGVSTLSKPSTPSRLSSPSAPLSSSVQLSSGMHTREAANLGQGAGFSCRVQGAGFEASAPQRVWD